MDSLQTLTQRRDAEISRRIAKLRDDIANLNLDSVALLGSTDPRTARREARIERQRECLESRIYRLQTQRPKHVEKLPESVADKLRTEAIAWRKARRNRKFAGLAFSLALANLAACDPFPNRPFFVMAK